MGPRTDVFGKPINEKKERKDQERQSRRTAGQGAVGMGKKVAEAKPKPVARKREPDSPETRRRKNDQAKARRDEKRGGPANPQARGHISNGPIYAALIAAGKPKQMAAGAANKHADLSGKERTAYIKKKANESFDPSKISKKKRK